LRGKKLLFLPPDACCEGYSREKGRQRGSTSTVMRPLPAAASISSDAMLPTDPNKKKENVFSSFYLSSLLHFLLLSEALANNVRS
jgi:hypothetical protein